MSINKNYIEANTSQITEVTKAKATRKLIITPSIIIIVLVVIYTFLGLFFLASMDSYTEKIYVTAYGGTYTATTSTGKSIKDFEVENFVKVFLKTAFSHDAESFKPRVEKALKFASKESGKIIIDIFNRGKLHEQYVKTGSSMELEIDSMYTDTKKTPHECFIFTRQKVFNGYAETEAPKGYHLFVNVTERTKANPYGLIIQDLSFFDYKPSKKEYKPNSVVLDTLKKDTLQK